VADIYTRLQSTASRLLAKYKQGTIVLSRAGTPTPAANEWDPPVEGALQTWTLNGTVTGVDKELIDGTTITAADEMATVAVFADTPRLTDVLTIDDKPRTILKVMPVPPAGTVCAWKIAIKG